MPPPNPPKLMTLWFICEVNVYYTKATDTYRVYLLHRLVLLYFRERPGVGDWMVVSFWTLRIN